MNWAKIITLLAVSVVASAQIQQPPPQTARQAVLEMLFSKSSRHSKNMSPSRHWKFSTKQIVDRPPPSWGHWPRSNIRQQPKGSTWKHSKPGRCFSTAEGAQGIHQQRVEVAVERDDLSGDDDQIELSIHIYKDGMPSRLPVVPGLILDLKQQKDIWRLSQITVALHVPPSDPEYVKGIAEEMRKNRQRMTEFGALGSMQQMKEKEIARQKKCGFHLQCFRTGFCCPRHQRHRRQ